MKTAAYKSIILATTMLSALPALAQTPVAPSAAAEASETTLDEIIVTAQRRSERLIDVPAAVSAFSGDDLKDRGVTQLRDVADQLSGVQIFRTATGQPAFIIRGVGLIETNPNNPPPTATYQDDVYQVTTAQAQSGIFDVERIEVLKGPQGGFYGRNTSGGVVRVMSRTPSLEKFEGNATVTYARFGKLTVEAGLSMPLSTDKLAIRIAGRSETGGGWQRSLSDNRDYGDASRWAVRGTIIAKPIEAMELKLIVDGGRDESENVLLRAVGTRALPSGGGVGPQYFCPALNAGRIDDNSCLTYPGALSGLGFTYLPTARPNTQSDDGRTVLSNAFGQSDIKNFGITFAANFDLGFANFVSTTGYRDFKYGRSADTDGTGAEFGHRINKADIVAWSQELRLQSSAGNDFGWAVGLAYSDESLQENVSFLLRDDPFAVTNFRVYGLALRSQADARLAYLQRSEMKAAFAEASYKFSPQIELRGSLRYTDLKKRYDNGGFNFPNGTAPIVSIALPITNFTLSNSYNMDSKWTGNASLSYKPVEEVLLYVSLGRGTKEGGFSGGFPTQGLDSIIAFTEEKVWSYEVGAKTRFMDGRVGANLTGFWYDYEDAQVTLPVRSQLTGAIFGRPGNADARHKGVEAEVFVTPFTGFRLDGSLTYLDAKYVDPKLFTTQDGTQVPLNGLTRPYAPKWSWTVRASYEVPLGTVGSLNFAVDANGRSIRNQPYVATTGTNREAALFTVNGYTLVNAKVGWRADDDKFSLAIFSRNLTGKAYVAAPATDGNGSFSELYGDPATYGIEASVKF
jgi:iron complex outermembrane recepter protein